MPIYEYQCQQCGHQLEVLQKISDQPLVKCPACHQNSLQKLVSAAGFRLSGSGWYETDFKTNNKKNLAKSDSQNSSTGSAKSGESKSSSDSKPASSSKSSTGS